MPRRQTESARGVSGRSDRGHSAKLACSEGNLDKHERSDVSHPVSERAGDYVQMRTWISRRAELKAIAFC